MTSETRSVCVRVPGVAQLTDGESRVFTFVRYASEEEGFVVCVAGELHAYANRCPHWNVDLDLGTRRFFDERAGAVICRNHGALFVPRTGVCRAGPCVGAALEKFRVTREGDAALVEIGRLSLNFAD